MAEYVDQPGVEYAVWVVTILLNTCGKVSEAMEGSRLFQNVSQDIEVVGIDLTRFGHFVQVFQQRNMMVTWCLTGIRQSEMVDLFAQETFDSIAQFVTHHIEEQMMMCGNHRSDFTVGVLQQLREVTGHGNGIIVVQR